MFIPRNLWRLLWRVFIPTRRNIAHYDGRHVGKPTGMDAARAARVDAEQKLSRTDDTVAHARGVLWRLRQHREYRSDECDQRADGESNHGDRTG